MSAETRPTGQDYPNNFSCRLLEIVSGNHLSYNFLAMGQTERVPQYPDEFRLKEILSSGQAMYIPRGYLFGRQVAESYDKQKRRLVEANLAHDGIKFLLNNPIIVCALPTQEGLKMVIIDGHHRTRYSGKFQIAAIPSIVYTPEQLTEAWLVKFGTQLTTEQLIEQLDRETADTLASFKTLPDEKLPCVVKGVTQIEDLPFKRL